MFLATRRTSEIKRIAELLLKGFHFACRFNDKSDEILVEFYFQKDQAYGFNVKKEKNMFVKGKIEEEVAKSRMELAEMIYHSDFYKEGGWL